MPILGPVLNFADFGSAFGQPWPTHCAWMDEIPSTAFMVETVVCWYLRWGIESFQG